MLIFEFDRGVRGCKTTAREVFTCSTFRSGGDKNVICKMKMFNLKCPHDDVDHQRR